MYYVNQEDYWILKSSIQVIVSVLYFSNQPRSQ